MLPGNGTDPFEQDLLAGMSGTRLQFGNFDTEQGEHGSGDRHPLNPTLRLASGMDIAAHRSWQGLDYTEVGEQSTVLFLDSDSTLFDVPVDLVVLDDMLAALEPQLSAFDGLDSHHQDNQRLDLHSLVQFELGRGGFDATYSLYRLPRSFLWMAMRTADSLPTPVFRKIYRQQTALIEWARQGAVELVPSC